MADACPFCGKSTMKKAVDLALHKGKTEAVHVLKCSSCGKSITELSEYERVRISIKPTLKERFLNFFKSDFKIVELHKGKLL